MHPFACGLSLSLVLYQPYPALSPTLVVYKCVHQVMLSCLVTRTLKRAGRAIGLGVQYIYNIYNMLCRFVHTNNCSLMN